MSGRRAHRATLSRSKTLFAVGAAAALAVACGGAAEKRPPQAPPPADAPAKGFPAAPPEGAPGTSGDPTGGADARQIDLKKASSDVESSRRELDESGTDCKGACRALASMDRAAGRLCKMSQTTDERARCDDARGKVYGARDKVRAICGSCPGGPSVERSAPIPSP